MSSYFCYLCARNVILMPMANSDLVCPICGYSYLGEPFPYPQLQPPNIYQNHQNPNSGYASASSSIRNSIPTTDSSIVDTIVIDLENPANFSPFVTPSPSDFNAYLFLHTLLQNLRARGVFYQFTVPSYPGFRLPINYGDYFIGRGFQNLILQLAENDPNRYGTPPASRNAIAGLRNVTVIDSDSDSRSCAICMSDYEPGEETKEMPCGHLFHSECLLPWLALHNSCPVCRHELPTEDIDYETMKYEAETRTVPILLSFHDGRFGSDHNSALSTEKEDSDKDDQDSAQSRDPV